MGFGLVAFGFLLLCVEGFGLDTVGYGLMAYGFWRIYDELREYRGFKIAAYAAACAVLPASVGLYEIIADMTGVLPAVAQAVWAVRGVLSALCFVVICFCHYGEVAKIAEDGGAKIFALRAKVTMYLSVLYSALLVVGGFMGATGNIAAIIFLGKLIIPFINALTSLTCFTTITTTERKVYEDIAIAEESERLKRKRLFKSKKTADEDEDDED